MKRVTYLFLLLGVVAFQACKIETAEPVFRNFYFFDIDVDMTNVKKEYNVNDIVWLEISIPNKFIKDESTGDDIFVGNARFPISLQAQEITNNPIDSNQVEIILQNGELTKDSIFNRNGIASFHFGCPESTYLYKVGVQFKKTGAYILRLNPEQTVKTIVFNEFTDCSIFENTNVLPTGTDVGSVSYLFGAADLNLDVFSDFTQNNTLNTSVNAVPGQINEKQAFFVKVI